MKNNEYASGLISSAEKTLQMIELVAQRNGKISVSEIAKEMNIHVSSADRYLLTLQHLGYVEKDAVTGSFRLNEKIISLSEAIIQSHPLTERYLTTMHTLAYTYKTTTHIMAFHNHKTVTLHKDLQTQNMSFNQAFYDPTRYYYCSGPGKLLLSTFSDEELDDYLNHTRIIIFTEKTLSSPQAIKDEIALIRQRGYSYHDEEWLPGNLTLSFPLRVKGEIKGAMSLMCSADRRQEMLSQTTIEKIMKIVCEPNR